MGSTDDLQRRAWNKSFSGLNNETMTNVWHISVLEDHVKWYFPLFIHWDEHSRNGILSNTRKLDTHLQPEKNLPLNSICNFEEAIPLAMKKPPVRPTTM